MFIGELQKSGASFYFAGMPTIGYDRRENGGKPYTFDQLSEKVRRQIAGSGVFNVFCSVNGDFFDEQFADKESLMKRHKKFLNDREQE